MNNDLISRAALRDQIIDIPQYNDGTQKWILLDSVYFRIDNAPAVGITEEQAINKLHETGWLPNHDKEMTTRPKGSWVFNGCDDVTFKCMFCGHEHVYVTSPRADGVNFCEQCGADMRGDAE